MFHASTSAVLAQLGILEHGGGQAGITWCLVRSGTAVHAVTVCNDAARHALASSTRAGTATGRRYPSESYAPACLTSFTICHLQPPCRDYHLQSEKAEREASHDVPRAAFKSMGASTTPQGEAVFASFAANERGVHNILVETVGNG